jgi:hypothetical protein
MRRLWTFNSKRSQVLEPSPQGWKPKEIRNDKVNAFRKEKHTVLRVVILRTLVGRRTGPLTRSCLSLARLMRSVETAQNSGTIQKTLAKETDTFQGFGHCCW